MSADLDAVFERNYILAEPHTMLMKAQVRSVYDRLLETRHLPGDCIEFGGYCGGLSFFLGLCIRDLGLAKRVIMLDSFQGLPQTDGALDGPFERGMMVSDLQSVVRARTALQLDDVVEIRAGWFEDTLPRMPPAARFCLAHLDADVYASTKSALRYLLPRLVPGGAVVLDDCLFFGATGVLRAACEEIGAELHLHLGPKTQAFLFPKGDPRSDRRAPVWRSLGGQRYDVAELLTRSDYLELAAWEEAFYREHALWYADYLHLLSGRPDLPADSHRVVAAIGQLRRR
jgi:Macrocin-O-methyltransferase (TylF)